MIVLKNVSRRWGSLTVLDGFDITFAPGEISCLFGPSGSGKTTLLDILTGLADPGGGSVRGTEGKRFSRVFQEHRLLPWCTVRENLLFVLGGTRSLSRGDGAGLLSESLELVGLSSFADSPVPLLSGGMTQRAALARALCRDFDILVLDEPFKGVDFKLKARIMRRIVERVKNEEKYCVFVTHDREEARTMSDSLHLLEGPPLKLVRTLKASGTPFRDELFEYTNLSEGKGA